MMRELCSLTGARPNRGCYGFGSGIKAFALALPLLVGACSWTPDWADPTEWFDDDSAPTPTSQVDENAKVPNLATVPDEPRTITSDQVRAQTVEGLKADQANADYTQETLTASGSLPQTPSAPAVSETTIVTEEIVSVPAQPAQVVQSQVAAAQQSATQQIAAVPQVPQAPQAPATGQIPQAPAGTSETTFIQVDQVATYSTPPVPQQSVRAAVIYFPYGVASLDAQDRQVLKDVVALQRQRNAAVRVVGHASSRTGNQSPEQHEVANFNISLKRANSVAAELVAMGVDQSMVTAEARSDAEPIYFEFMPNGEAGNRRAEIFLEF